MAQCKAQANLHFRCQAYPRWRTAHARLQQLRQSWRRDRRSSVLRLSAQIGQMQQAKCSEICPGAGGCEQSSGHAGKGGLWLANDAAMASAFPKLLRCRPSGALPQDEAATRQCNGTGNVKLPRGAGARLAPRKGPGPGSRGASLRESQLPLPS